jgi:hypothetical protein
VWSKSAVFWKTERALSVFSIGIEKKDISGFSGIGPDKRRVKGARIGLIFSYVWYMAFYTFKGGTIKNQTVKYGRGTGNYSPVFLIRELAPEGQTEYP